MKKKILVVDDQPGIRLLLTDVLESQGYDIFTAKTGKEAVDEILEKPFDLILLDFQLPIYNGGKVIEEMEVNDTLIPVIMMTGWAENDAITSIKSSLLIDVIEKPFNILEICKRVKSALAKVD